MDDAPTHGMLLVVTIIWGLGWTAGRTVASGVPEATGAWIRYAIASVWLLLYMFYSTKGEIGADLPTRLRFPEKVDKMFFKKKKQ